MAENEKMDSLSRMFNTLIRTPLSEVESVIRKGNLEQQPVAPVEELTDTYTKMAAENEPMTFTENIDKPQVNQEFLADAPSFMELIPKEERLDESKFQQKVVLDTDGVYRLKTFPIEENVKTNPDILKEQIGVEQGLLEKPVEDFGGVMEAMESERQRLEKEDIKSAEKMIENIESKKQKLEEEPKDKQEFKLPPSDETSRYFNNPLELYKGIKNNNDKIMSYLYGGISKKEWAGQKPIFDFVAISRKDKGKPTSSAFGPVQIVGNTVRDAMTRIKKGTEEYNFANRLQAAQNLFINLANKYKAGKNFNEQTARETARTDAGEPALKTLGITEDQFIEYVKEGYFLPSNQEKSKGLPPEILGDNYKENYYKLFKNVLSNKSVGTDSLEETIKKYYGHPSEKKKTKYMKDVFENLNLPITQEKE